MDEGAMLRVSTEVGSLEIEARHSGDIRRGVNVAITVKDLATVWGCAADHEIRVARIR